MTLREYIKVLDDFVRSNQECLDMVVVASSDDEGNSFSPVVFEPSKGYFVDKEYLEADSLEEYGFLEEDINAVCIN